MRIRYENTVDDFVALGRFHNEHSPTVRRALVRVMWAVAGGFLLIAAGLAIKLAEAGWPVVLGAVGLTVATAILTTLLIPGAFRRKVERQTRRMYAEGTNKSALGPHEMELVGDELVTRTALAESRMRLEAVERVVSTAGYTFIYVNALSAHVIPHDAVSEGDPETFAEAIRQRLGSALS